MGMGGAKKKGNFVQHKGKTHVEFRDLRRFGFNAWGTGRGDSELDTATVLSNALKEDFQQLASGNSA